MMPMGKHLPPRVFAKHGRYYLVRADGQRRIWQPLTRVQDGLPDLYRALSTLERARIADDRMPAVVADWQRDVMVRHAAKTQIDDIARCRVVANAFAEFRAAQVSAPDVAEFLLTWRDDRPRTHNAYRALVGELLRYAVERGYRTDNPVAHLRTMRVQARTRYISDSELRRIKVAGLRGADGRPTRAGRMLAALVDIAYLTGQRIGDLLELRWERDADESDAPHVADEGLRFRPQKTRQSTGASIVIEWTPRLRDAVERVRALQAERLLRRRADQRVISGYLFTTIGGRQLSYWGASSMWRRAVQRAGVAGVHLHDVRAKALTDKDASEGMQAAKTMGAHSTEAQTADYVRHRTARKTRATR